MTDPQPSDEHQQQHDHQQQQPEAADVTAAGSPQPPEDDQQQQQNQQLLLQQQLESQAPPFAPIYTLVNNTSTRTTHHPQVQYIFSDEDPDLLTQALAQQHNANLNESADDPAPEHRAILLDLSQDPDGRYSVASASSLSPSWAVIDARVSRISPPSSDGDGSNPGNPSEAATADALHKKPERLMLRIEGVESRTLGNEGELRLPNERGGPGGGSSGSGSNSGSGIGSGQKDRDKAENDDYSSLVDEFDKRMGMLRKVVDAGEDRRRKAAADAARTGGAMPDFNSDAAHPQPSAEETPEYPDSG